MGYSRAVHRLPGGSVRLMTTRVLGPFPLVAVYPSPAALSAPPRRITRTREKGCQGQDQERQHDVGDVAAAEAESGRVDALCRERGDGWAGSGRRGASRRPGGRGAPAMGASRAAASRSRSRSRLAVLRPRAKRPCRGGEPVPRAAARAAACAADQRRAKDRLVPLAGPAVAAEKRARRHRSRRKRAARSQRQQHDDRSQAIPEHFPTVGSLPWPEQKRPFSMPLAAHRRVSIGSHTGPPPERGESTRST